jgi:hypothetical protein
MKTYGLVLFNYKEKKAEIRYNLCVHLIYFFLPLWQMSPDLFLHLFSK